jgi:hypothetical protein
VTFPESNPSKRPDTAQWFQVESDDGETVDVVTRSEYEALLADRESWKRLAYHYQSLLGERGLL